MRKKAGTLMILLGAIVIALAVFQFFEYRIQTKQALTEARTLIEPSPNGHIPAMVQVASPDPRRDALAGRQKFKPEESDVLGVLEIPKIKAELPMIEGTDEEMLDRGVGHYSASALPLDGEQILLSGHRDTVFRNFAKLELGDRFIVKLPYGHSNTKYRARRSSIKTIPRSFVRWGRKFSSSPRVIHFVTWAQLPNDTSCTPTRYRARANPIQNPSSTIGFGPDSVSRRRLGLYGV
ncbi:sortase [Cohnella xylanilytica]|uniref:sortase n=1 Tax=Cohnella xylanilytica TaxID=557555 RepID=UPI0040633D9C